MLLYKSGYKEPCGISQVKFEKSYVFSKHTTYGLGGKADIAYYPTNVLQLKAVCDCLKSLNKEFVIVGNGSNLLVSDSGYKGSVISTKRLTGIVRVSEKCIYCLSGTSIASILKYCRNHSLGGLEYLYGIPATVGGAAYMNAGVGKDVIGNSIQSVRIFNGNFVNLSKNKCNFGYRYSTMRDINAVIAGVFVSVTKSKQSEIKEKTDYYKARRAGLPGGRSCGCVFKNPDGISAGKLIENCGLKGLSCGRAVVSDKHANFIINRGDSAADVKRLISLVKARVYNKFGLLLHEEVVYIGEFYDIDS